MATIEDLLRTAQAAIALGDITGAAEAYRQLAREFPENKKAIWHAANGLRACNQPQEAVDVLETGLVNNPMSIALLNLTAETFLELSAPSSALAHLERVAEILPNDSASWKNIEFAKARINEQVKRVDKLPAEVTTMLELAFSADQMHRYDEARANYEAVLEQDPDNLLALSRLLTFDGIEGRLSGADSRYRLLVDSLSQSTLESPHWAHYWQHLGAVAYQNVIRPLPQDLYSSVMKALNDHLIEANRKYKIIRPPGSRRKHRRLKVGYLSSYFRDHPVGHVIAGHFARHDRSKFDIHVFHCSNISDASYTDEIRRGAEHFFTLSGSENEIANQIAARDLDILIYIDGVMSLPLLPVVASRPAPIQIFWLGHAGSCDLSCIDYVIADSVVIPPGEESLYSTKVVRLPKTFHCTSPHSIAPEMGRERAGLPDDGFVFCAFNNPEKIDSTIFDTWMNILRRVPKSVLWLSRTLSPAVETNLRAAAKSREIEGDRLIFAQRVSDKAVHLSRQRLAGLFLDTATLNASTTAIDALWTGLPVLTVHGTRFSSRIATSHLKAIGLDDMICQSLTAYEDRAVYLATHPDDLDEIRQRLIENRETYPLFRGEQFCADFEQCLEMIYRTHSG